MAHYVVFDIETRIGPDDPSLAHLASDDERWDVLRRGEGGISALAVYDSKTDWVSLYDDTCADAAAAHLESAEFVIGYNSRNFDIPCLEGVLGRKLVIPRHVDLLDDVWARLAERDFVYRPRGYKLNDLCLRCFAEGKVDSGDHAPKLAAGGQWARLFHYCLDDVRLTRKLLHFIATNGGVWDANGQWLNVALPPALASCAEGAR